jgi:hypothetical protein
MATDLPDLSPDETVMVALDAAIGVLVTARALLERVIVAKAQEGVEVAPPEDPFVTMGAEAEGCQHENATQMQTMDGVLLVCPCGEVGRG